MNIKKYRLLKGYTQKQLAEILNITQSAYSYKENGERPFDVEELLQLEILLEASINDFYKEKKEEYKNKLNK